MPRRRPRRAPPVPSALHPAALAHRETLARRGRDRTCSTGTTNGSAWRPWSPARHAASSPACCLAPAASLCCHHSMATVAPDLRERAVHRYTVALLVALLCLVWGSTWWAIRL